MRQRRTRNGTSDNIRYVIHASQGWDIVRSIFEHHAERRTSFARVRLAYDSNELYSNAGGLGGVPMVSCPLDGSSPITIFSVPTSWRELKTKNKRGQSPLSFYSFPIFYNPINFWVILAMD